MFDKTILCFSLFVLLFASGSVYAQSIDTGITGYEPPSSSTSDESANNSIDLDSLVNDNPQPTGVESSGSNSTSGTTITGVEFTGDTKLACEAILCLSSPTRPGECSASLSRYFSINADKWKDTVKKRKNFLNQCPTSNEDANMASLVNTLAEGSGLCTIDILNNTGNWREITVKTGDNYNQCRRKTAVVTTAPSGKKVTVSYQWHSKNDTNSRNRSYCLETTRYFKVTEYAPGQCTSIWNHIYTDYSQRLHVVKGTEPWQTHWVE